MGAGEVRRAVGAGRLRHVRRGWYAEPDAHVKVVRAVAGGGVLGCASALSFVGAWDATDGVVHVRTSRDAAWVTPPGLCRCAPAIAPEPAPRHAVDDPAVALRSAWRCLDRQVFVALCDSLVDRGLATMDDLRFVMGGVPGAPRALDSCARAESGTESLVRLRLRARGITVVPQVWIPGVGRVDLLVGERLVIEVDSRAHHTGTENYRNDRRRDLELRAAGYVVVRLTYEQVLLEWEATEQALLAMVRRGDHWWGARRGTRQMPAPARAGR